MKQLLSALNRIPEFEQLCSAVDYGACPAAFSGLGAVHRAYFAAGLHRRMERPVAVVCADEGEAERMARDLASFTGEEVRTLQAREFTFHNDFHDLIDILLRFICRDLLLQKHQLVSSFLLKALFNLIFHLLSQSPFLR